MPTKLIATALALVAFAAAVIGGLAADNPAETILWRALAAMIGCYFVGLLIGALGQRAIEEHIVEYKKEHPLLSVEDLATQMEATQSTRGAPEAPNRAGESAA